MDVGVVELFEQHPQFTLSLGEAALVAVLDLDDLIEIELGVGAQGAAGVGDGVHPAEALDAPVDAGDLVEQEVVVDVFGEHGPVLFEQAQVGVDGGDRDLDRLGDLLEGVSVLAELVLAEDSAASSG